MNHRSFITTACLLFALPDLQASAAEYGWPVVPADSDHPIINTLGEFVRGKDNPYQHDGIDIAAKPFDEGEDAPFARVVVSGMVQRWVMNSTGKDNSLAIRGNDGRIYRYTHLEATQISQDLRLKLKDGRCEPTPSRSCEFPLVAGDAIAKISNLFPCGLHHLHLDVSQQIGESEWVAVNPLLEIQPRPDLSSPEVFKIHLARAGSNPWEVIEPGENGDGSSCTAIDGNVAIVVEVKDSDHASSELDAAKNVGLYSVEWRVCPASTPECEWQPAFRYDTMPAKWAFPTRGFAAKHFSITSPWITTTEPWSAEVFSCPGPDYDEVRTFMVLPQPASGDWLAAVPAASRDEEMSLSVRVSDVAENDAELSRAVCAEDP